MKKKWIILISNILSGMLFLICLSGCKWFQDSKPGSKDPWKNAQVEGEFLYYVKNESAVILNVDGVEREELVIPETLGGYPVERIGTSYSTGFGTGPSRFYGITAKNTKKIVLNHFTILRQYSFIEFNGTLVINSEQEYTNSANYKGGPMVKNMKSVFINVPRDIDNHYSIYYLFNSLDESHYGVIFHANVDDVATSGIINHIETDLEIPEEPTKQGYRFVDWYTDIDRSEIWNPDESKIGEKVTDVYAKWIEE